MPMPEREALMSYVWTFTAGAAAGGIGVIAALMFAGAFRLWLG